MKAGPIPNLTPDEMEAVAEFAALLRHKFGSDIKDIIIFGSKIKGTADRFSDIDIVLVLRRLTWDIKKAISELAAEENIKHNVLISTIRYDVKAWETPVIKASPFVSAVRNEGVRL